MRPPVSLHSIDFTALLRHHVMLLINTLSPHWSTKPGDGIRPPPRPFQAYDGRRRRRRWVNGTLPPDVWSGISHRSLPNLHAPPLFTTIWRGCQGLAWWQNYRLTGSEHCQTREENPGGKWPFCRSCLSVLHPHSVVLAKGLQCWRRLPWLSTRQHLAHLASKTCPYKQIPSWISHKPQRSITLGCFANKLTDQCSGFLIFALHTLCCAGLF